MGKIRFERYVCFEVRPSVGLEAKHPTRSNIPSARALMHQKAYKGYNIPSSTILEAPCPN